MFELKKSGIYWRGFVGNIGRTAFNIHSSHLHYHRSAVKFLAHFNLERRAFQYLRKVDFKRKSACQVKKNVL